MKSSEILRVAVKSVSRSATDGEHERDKLMLTDERIAQLLCPTLGYPYELVSSVDGEYGRIKANGNWTGMIGMLQREEVDVVMSFLVPTEERSRVVTFSYPFNFDSMTFITHKPEMLDHIFSFLHPFSREVWLYLIVSTCLMFIAFNFFLHKRYKYDVVLLGMVGSLLRQSWKLKTERWRDSMLWMIWLIGVMLASWCYSAVLLSYLSFPPTKGVRNIAELSRAVAKGSYQCKTYPGSVIPGTLLKFEDESFKIIGRNLMKNNPSGDPVEVLQNTRRGVAFVGVRNHFRSLEKKYFVSTDNFFTVIGTSAFGKKFCCKRSLDRAIHRATAAGLFKKIHADTSFFKHFTQLHETHETDLERELSVSDLSGAFILLVSGYVFACLALVYEILKKKISSIQ